MANERIIRNSTADFLMFALDGSEQGIQVYVQDETVWLTQKAMAALFDCSVANINMHLKGVFADGELSEEATIKEFLIVAEDGKNRTVKHYNLDAVISVGYRINSLRATQFRQWATKVLSAFTRQGYVLDKQRLKNGQVFSTEYFDRLTQEYQEIRASERMFYQKVTDIYATAYDYSVDAKQTKDFFAKVQNKMHYAVHGRTAAEVIVDRADHTKRNMGLITWAAAPKGRIVKGDVSIAKNYLTEDELKNLNEIVTMYLDYATRQARRHIHMSMEDWTTKLDAFLQFNDEEILQGKGSVAHAIAKAFAESEFEKYRVIQDREYRSDFDVMMQQLLFEEGSVDDGENE
jgi:hypothetical protein